MPADRFGEPWPGATYKGFSGAPGHPPARSRRWRPSRGALIGGLAATAVALGLAAGFAFRPDHRSLSVDPETSVAKPMPIEVNAPPPPPVARPAGKLEVLNPATAQAARAAQPAWADTASTTPPPAPAAPVQARDVTTQVAPASPQVTAAPRPSPMEACAGARSRSEALLCADPELAAYDRELTRAYRRAMRSGAVAPNDLRADQRDWLDDRERVARRSPETMADLYQQRIEELDRIADDGPGDGDF